MAGAGITGRSPVVVRRCTLRALRPCPAVRHVVRTHRCRIIAGNGPFNGRAGTRAAGGLERCWSATRPRPTRLHALTTVDV